MKIFGVAKLTCLLALTSQMMFAGNSAEKLTPRKYSISSKTDMIAKSHTEGNRYATSAFSNGTYNVDFPSFTGGFAVLSQNRNFGKKSGAIELTSQGVKILKRGDYSVSFSALYVSRDFDSSQVILMTSKDFDLNNPLNVYGYSIFDVLSSSNQNAQGSGILRNVAPGTKLSLVIRSLSSSPDRATVKNWKISISEIKN